MKPKLAIAIAIIAAISLILYLRFARARLPAKDAKVMIDEMAAFRDRMCACKDQPCRDGVGKDLSSWSLRLSSVAPPEDADADKFNAISQAMTKCMTAGKPAASP